jgi:CrcB protein
MRKYFYIGCGSFIGAVLRYLAKGIRIVHDQGNIPLNTLLVNVAGAFLIAFILTIAFEVRTFDADLRLGLTTGLLGAFTTFSSMCKAAGYLLHRGEYLHAILYLSVSAVLGIAAAFLGAAAAREAGLKLAGQDQNDDRADGGEREGG